MNAKECFELKKCPPSIFGKYDMIEFAESYHQTKSKEEVEERYNKACRHYKEHGRLNLGEFNMLVLDNTIRIASGREEI